MSLQLEVGKKYKDRIGDVCEIYAHVGGIYPYIDKKGFTYTVEGKFDLESTGLKMYDLIEEVK